MDANTADKVQREKYGIKKPGPNWFKTSGEWIQEMEVCFCGTLMMVLQEYDVGSQLEGF